MTSTKQDPLAEYQSRIEYLEAQGRLMERHLQSDNPLSAEDIADLETIINRALAANDYILNELEDLHLKKGRIYGRANVTSIKTNDGDMSRYHTATITFHTDHAYSVVFDDHKIGGDEWATPTDNVVFKLTYNNSTQKLYLNDVPIYSFKAANTRIVLKALFEQSGLVKEITRIKDMYGVPHTDRKKYTINTKSMANNINDKSGLRDHGLSFMVSSFDYDWGIRIITQLTDSDLVKNNVDKEAIEEWLSSKTISST